tara:strand:+ start:57 stop:1022 length:966 start_codon:yes stop_codon:yes gene_type:complete
MKIGIIGCGLIGNKRAESIGSQDKIKYVYDINIERSKKLAKKTGAAMKSSIKEILESEVDIIFVATTHNMLSDITIKAIKKRKHVLVEKPGAYNLKELKKIILLSKKNKVTVKVGFNHRFHPAILKAKKLVDEKNLGEILFIRGRYGHGGRIGYESEWRCNKKLSGGGELLDQGSHLIDLSLWFMGKLEVDYKLLPTYFWDTNVEDNCFISLKNKKDNVAWLHASWTEWKNCFSFEIYTKKTKLIISGLGGSYGKEKLTFYKMRPKMGPPIKKEWKFGPEDNSWRNEFINFKKAIKNNSEPCGSADDALNTLKLIEDIYKN